MISVDGINKLQVENKRLNDIIDSYQPRIQKYKDVLQEIKTIVETCLSGVSCTECPFTNECKTDYEVDALGVCQMILQKITKAEEE